ncbi:hypothetical protein SAMN04489806_1169 [Paramicrobacterium humi]|uniref:Uncharacterized protein n=1 Tax=Paramicrobacterium humi TaxID=640635 RepID=A0A1H4KH66_9MICO|nr:hypothetical protein SAMN04489806_1169 [Microbacterium humi]
MAETHEIVGDAARHVGVVDDDAVALVRRELTVHFDDGRVLLEEELGHFGGQGRHDDAGRARRHERARGAELLVEQPFVVDEKHRVTAAAGTARDSRGEVRVERIAQIGDDDADRAVLLLAETAGHGVRHVAEFLSGGEHPLPGRRGDVALTAQRAGGCRLGDAGESSDVLEGRTSLPRGTGCAFAHRTPSRTIGEAGTYPPRLPQTSGGARQASYQCTRLSRRRLR